MTRIATSDQPAVAMRISGIEPQGVEDIRSIRLVPASADRPNFTFIPGQFLHIRTPSGEASYFAIASVPGEPYFDVLVKRAQGASREMFDLPVGTTVSVVGPQGKGFPLDAYEGFDVLLIGVGTGIAPLRSVAGWVLANRRRFGRLTLLYGVLTPSHWCYRSDFSAWQAEGVHTRVTVTSTEGLAWSGPVGFVQAVLSDMEIDPRRTVACLVGMKDMVRANTELLTHRGVPSDRILLNF
ncbi:MAG TPA: oxidoreductase [Nitrospiria bacterium]|nr:oxidoreductase [Nitrospiria bacterium]